MNETLYSTWVALLNDQCDSVYDNLYVRLITYKAKIKKKKRNKIISILIYLS